MNWFDWCIPRSMDWVASEQFEQINACEAVPATTGLERVSADEELDEELDEEQLPCTHAGHQQATSTYEEFLSSTSNHRPWQEPDRDIDIVLGDCMHCHSTLGWSNRELPALENETPLCPEEWVQPVTPAPPAPTNNTRRKTLSRFLIEEAVITHEQLVKTQALGSESLSEALIETGVVTAETLKPFLRAYEQTGNGATEIVHAMLRDRPQSQTLETITNQLIRSLTNTVGVRVVAESSHTNAYDTAPCDYTVSQSLVGDFEGDVYFNLSSALILQISSITLARKAASVRDLVEESARSFLNTVNSNACVQLSAQGIQVALLKPRLHRHTQVAGERTNSFDLATRSIGAVFTSVRLAHPGGQQELCFVDATGRF